MSRCVVLGASGQIGRFLVPRLRDAQHVVIAVSRSERAPLLGGVHWQRGDLYQQMPSFPSLDGIFSLGPLDGLANWLAHAHVDGSPHVIAFGSMSAVSKRESNDAEERALAVRLIDAEQRATAAAQDRGWPITVLRPTLIYGAGLDRSVSALVRIARKTRVFPLLPGASGLRQPVHAEDLANACTQAWRRTETFGRTYALGGGERLPCSIMLARVRRSMAEHTLGLPLPLSLAALTASIARHLPGVHLLRASAVQRLREDLIADDRAARTDFGWAPRGFAPDPQTWRERAFF